MKNILARGGIEFLAVFIGIILSLWVDDKRNLKSIRDNNYNTKKSLKVEIKLRVDYIETKIKQYERDINVGEYVINNWGEVSIDSVIKVTEGDRDILLTLKAYRAINLPISVYNSLNSDGSIGHIEEDTIKIALDDLYEVFPAHIVDGVENERVLYHSLNKYIIEHYPTIVDGEINQQNKNKFDVLFNDDIILGYTIEKTNLRKFILGLIVIYKKRLVDLERLL
tara:strand:- start:132 stop:803 length:672 start_codon:yes stop_codon:yes gene_type:complete